MEKKTITVNGVNISLFEENYISLNEIIKSSSDEPTQTIRSWIKNTNTIKFLWAWEEINNPNFTELELKDYLFKVTENRYNLSPSKWEKETKAIGMRTKMGRGGGTYVHQEIALEFCSWYDPYFKVYLMKEFQRLKEEESKLIENTQTWHISKITDYVDNARILLDSIPGQLPEKRRVKVEEEE